LKFIILILTHSLIGNVWPALYLHQASMHPTFAFPLPIGALHPSRVIQPAAGSRQMDKSVFTYSRPNVK
jgi:hypothetical protein